jgi:hypothetical protein
MGADQQTWDYGVRFDGKKSKPLKLLKPAHDHDLQFNRVTQRWGCACGYALGDGREKLLARCPVTMKLQ